MAPCTEQLAYHTTKRPRIDYAVKPPLTKRPRIDHDHRANAAAIRRIDEFEMLNKIGEGAYGVVYRARDKRTGEIVAVKKVMAEAAAVDKPLGFRLPETEILTSLNHHSIVDLKHVVAGSRADSLFIVMEYAENDLRSLLEAKKQPFTLSQVKCLMQQLLEGVDHLHRNKVIHRDLKTSNLLLNNRGELKICDFGLARRFENPSIPHTQTVVTLWYRAPELLLGSKHYSTAIDMWSVGCIMAELLSGAPLFDGTTDIDQLGKIIKVLGSPNEAIWAGFSKLPGVKGVKVANMVKNRCSYLRQRFPLVSFTGSPVVSNAGFDLLSRLLTYDPRKRMTAEEALDHGWFREVPRPNTKDFMPTFPPNYAETKKVDPLQEQWRKELQQRDLGNVGLFGL